MFADMRTGSNLLEALLNALPGVVCHGEVFNPHFIGKMDQTAWLGVSLAARDDDPLALLARMKSTAAGMTGFRYFHDHDPRVFDAVMADPRCAKIILTRNPVESYVSWKIAQATGQWKLTNAKNAKVAKARFDGPEFEAHLSALQAFQLQLLHGLQTSGQTAFYLDYEDIPDLAVLNGLATFLGADPVSDAPQAPLKKQNPAELAEKVQNPLEMAAALARIDRFNLARTPNFEPRRGPAIPAMLASADAPLLFLPMRGGVEDDVARWLGSFGDNGLMRDFSQKELRQWKRSNPCHRSFTVISHPVARAHRVFCNQILGGRMAEIRAVLMRQHKIDLATPDTAAVQPLADHRKAFLGFLRFVKQSLAGQTALRVDPHWASQSAILQGFAQVQTPDLVLREDRLTSGLNWLAQEVGMVPPTFVAAGVTAPHALADVCDDDVEVAVREAYQRDYVAFGFDRWRPV